MRVAIIGAGTIADACHAPAILATPSAELTAVMSRSVDTGSAFLTRHGSTGAVHTNIADLAADPNVELVIVCTPDKLHFEHARACLMAGKHVLLEKPVTTDLSQAQDLAELADRNGLTLASGYHLRSHAGHQVLKELLDGPSTPIGDIRHVRATWAFPQKDASNWRAHNDLGRWWSLGAVGTHCLDLIRWFGGSTSDWIEIRSLTTDDLWSTGHDETAMVVGRLDNGVTGEAMSSIQFGTYHRLEIFGTGGTAVCHGTMGREGRGLITVNDENIDFVPTSPFVTQLGNVIDAATTGAPLNSAFEVGVRALKDLLLVKS